MVHLCNKRHLANSWCEGTESAKLLLTHRTRGRLWEVKDRNTASRTLQPLHHIHNVLAGPSERAEGSHGPSLQSCAPLTADHSCSRQQILHYFLKGHPHLPSTLSSSRWLSLSSSLLSHYSPHLSLSLSFLSLSLLSHSSSLSHSPSLFTLSLSHHSLSTTISHSLSLSLISHSPLSPITSDCKASRNLMWPNRKAGFIQVLAQAVDQSEVLFYLQSGNREGKVTARVSEQNHIVKNT